MDSDGNWLVCSRNFFSVICGWPWSDDGEKRIWGVWLEFLFCDLVRLINFFQRGFPWSLILISEIPIFSVQEFPDLILISYRNSRHRILSNGKFIREVLFPKKSAEFGKFSWIFWNFQRNFTISESFHEFPATLKDLLWSPPHKFSNFQFFLENFKNL